MPDEASYNPEPPEGDNIEEEEYDELPFSWSIHSRPEGYDIICPGCSTNKQEIIHHYTKIVIAQGFPGNYSHRNPGTFGTPIRFEYKDSWNLPAVGFVWVGYDDIAEFEKIPGRMSSDGDDYFLNIISKPIKIVVDSLAIEKFNNRMKSSFKNLWLLK